MRKINDNFEIIPELLKKCAFENEANLLENRIINKVCYKQAKVILKSQFHSKCAYCESKYLVTSDTWIEHYRPKSVYYWLAYEWSNLLPSCSICNRSKSDNFPLIYDKNKIIQPPIMNHKLIQNELRANNLNLLNESPYILHPKIDDPEKFFDYRIDENKIGIEIFGIDNEGKNDIEKKYKGKGEATIQICNLNRNELKINRFKIIENFINSINIIFISIKKGIIKADKIIDALNINFEYLIQNSKNEKLEYTLLYQKIINQQNFIEIIGAAIENESQRKIVIKAYKLFVYNNL